MQIAPQITIVYPSKQQRNIDEKTTGFKHVPIIRYHASQNMDRMIVHEKLRKKLYVHCILGQEVMLYPALECKGLENSFHFHCNNFTGEDGLRYTSAVMRYYRQKHPSQPSLLGHQLAAAIDGEFPFNNLTLLTMQDPHKAAQVMRRVTTEYDHRTRISLDQVIRCIKERENRIKNAKSQIQIMKEAQDEIPMRVSPRLNQNNKHWNQLLCKANSVRAKTERTFQRRLAPRGPLSHNSILEMKEHAQLIDWLDKGSVSYLLRKMTIFKPCVGQEEFLMNKVFIEQNLLNCLIAGITPAEEDRHAQSIIIGDACGERVYVCAKHWDEL